MRVLAILLALAGTVGNVLVYLAVGAGRSEWSRMVFDVAWVWAVTSLLLALAFVVRSAAALLTLEVVRAEIEVAPLATSANQHHAD